MRSRYLFIVIVVLLVVIALFFFTMDRRPSNDYYAPVPRAYCKIDLPPPNYSRTGGSVIGPFSFEKPGYGIFQWDEQGLHITFNDVTYTDLKEGQRYFVDFGAELRIKTNLITNNLEEYIDEMWDNLNKQKYGVPDSMFFGSFVSDGIYGELVELEGAVMASNILYLTDSTNYFVTMSLIFDDELIKVPLPIVNFLRKDLRHIIQSFRWETE